MITITGKSVFGGVSIGKLSFIKKSESDQKRTRRKCRIRVCKISGSKSRGIRQLKNCTKNRLPMSEKPTL